MFSPSIREGGPATATRSRRRQRPVSQDNIAQQPKAKRQRIPLTEQTFVNPDNHPEHDAIEVRTEKPPVSHPRSQNIENRHHIPTRKEPNVRAKKTKHGDRAANKGDGSLVLTSTSAYTVSKLPALPDRIRADWTANQNAEIFSSLGYALTLTAAHAIVWPYTSTSQSPETFTFTLPSANKPTDPLPVGCLVSPSAASTEPGLVVVMAGSGRVIYWESISSAATFAFIKKERSGVEYNITGISSSEKAVAITNAESAGFILTFNTGRLAYMSVRDSHGRPAISVQFLRTNLSASSGGIFGSIRHAFSNLSLRGDIAAVRADRSGRVGERNIVAMGTKGRLQAWRINRGGHSEPIGESDMRDEIVAALNEADPMTEDFPAESLETLDFTFVPKGLEPKYLELSRLSNAMGTDDSMVQHLLLLVSLTRKSISRYAMVELVLTPTACRTGMIRPITSYATPVTQSDVSSSVRPRIYLPRPALVAFVVFDRAAIIASVALQPESPDSQLQSDNHVLPPSFEDVIDFREDQIHEVVGSGFEETPAMSGEESRMQRFKTKNPAAMLMVRGAGVIRLITTDVDKFASEKPPEVSAKNKLEQAVFFGVKQDNPLLFSGREETKFSDEQIANAALEVSTEILGSTSSYMSTLPANLEDNLRARSYALDRLILHLGTIGAELDRKTKWELLHNAEKMHVATLLWKRHESFTTSRSADDKKSLIGSIVEFIHEGSKRNPIAKLGEVDKVRHWFINDVFRLELFVAWAYEVIKVMYKDRLLDDAKVTVMLYEAIQIFITTNLAALEFRKKNLTSYGLGDEELRMGILRDGYEGIAEPWTGSFYVANNMKRLVDLSEQWVINNSDLPAKTATTPDPKIIAQIFNDLPALTDVMLTSVLEHARFTRTLTAPEDRKMAQEFAKVYNTDRNDISIRLARSGHWDQAAKIAKKHECLGGLAIILLDHVESLEKELKVPGLSPSERKNLNTARASKKTEIERSFVEYGQDFAFPLYDFLLGKHGTEAVLEFDLDKLGYKTKFLRSKPELAKISWINDIQQEKDVDVAAETLVNLATTKEQQVWNKKIELSLGKLALLAEAESKAESGDFLKVKADEARHEVALKKVTQQLMAIRIQDELYNLIVPTTREAVDDAAALNFAMEAHGMDIPRRQKAIHHIFEDGLKRLLKHEALDAMTLIDLLTLIYIDPITTGSLMADPFWLALKVADECCHSDELRDAKRLIWRRLFIRDDWAKINDTSLKVDSEVIDCIADTSLFKMMKDCVRYQNVQEPFRPMVPLEAQGAFTDKLDRRFRDFDSDFQIKLKDAMKWEDRMLLQYLEKNRLAEWLPTALKTASLQVQEEADAATMAGAVNSDMVPAEDIEFVDNA